MTLRSPDQVAIDARLALASGDRSRARQLAQQALSLDASNEIAWLVLAALASGERRKAYLEHVLLLHPLSRAARAGLESLALQRGRADPGARDLRGAPPPASATQPIPPAVRQVLSPPEPAGGSPPISPAGRTRERSRS